jgi:hypothetical protein
MTNESLITNVKLLVALLLTEICQLFSDDPAGRNVTSCVDAHPIKVKSDNRIKRRFIDISLN